MIIAFGGRENISWDFLVLNSQNPLEGIVSNKDLYGSESRDWIPWLELNTYVWVVQPW